MKILIIIKNLALSSLLLVLASSLSYASHSKSIAITIDDLPFVGEYRNFHLDMLIKTLKEQQVPATGFIIAREVRQENWATLKKFRDAGLGLGNHTYSHANLNKLKTKEYINDIKKADELLMPVMTEPKYFRYPYLAMSSGTKKDKILCYLAENNYQIAPITIDSKDFAFNQRLLSVPEMERREYLKELKPFYIDFIWQQTVKAEQNKSQHSQILLIHANLLNAYVLPDIINLYKAKGYTFVNLQEALDTLKHQAQCSKPEAFAKKKPSAEKQQLARVDVIPKTDIEAFFDWD